MYYVSDITAGVVTIQGFATIGAGGVGTAQIDALAVTTAKIAANAVTSAKISVDVIQYVKVALSAANFLGMYATPVVLVAAGGANTLHQVKQAVFEVDYGGAQFANGGAVLIQYDNTANGAGAPASATTASAVFNAFVADGVVGAQGSLASAFR